MATLKVKNRLWRVTAEVPNYGYGRDENGNHPILGYETDVRVYARRHDAIARANAILHEKNAKLIEFAIADIEWQTDKEWMEKHGLQVLLDNLQEKGEVVQSAEQEGDTLFEHSS